MPILQWKLKDDKRFNCIEDILKSQGINDINRFIKPTLKDVEDFRHFDNLHTGLYDYLLPNCKPSKHISIVVDCDVDGFTSASLIYQYLKDSGLIANEPNFYIHEGKRHGVDDLVKELSSDNSDLIIVPDAGSSDDFYFTQIQELASKPKQILVLDHHLREARLNRDCECACIINNQTSDNVKNKTLTGVGVVYKFCKYIDSELNINLADDYLDLVAIGMIADRTDLTNPDTRYLVMKGLSDISHKTNKNKFISELIKSKSYNLRNKVTANDISFLIAPLINSCVRLGCMSHQEKMLNAFCNSDEKVKRTIRGKGECAISVQEDCRRDCETYIREQKKIVNRESEKLLSQLNSNPMMKNLAILLFNASNTPQTYTGLIANTMSGIFKRPVLLLRKSYKSSMLSGSGRGYDKSIISDFNKWCSNTSLFEKVAGHPNSFGVSIDESDIDRLLNVIQKIEYKPDLYYTVYNYFDDKTLSSQIVSYFGKYDYCYGCGVEEPLFYVKDININKSKLNISDSEKAISFNWRGIEFKKYSRSPMTELVNEINNIPNAVKFNMICKFTMSNTNKPCVMIEDVEVSQGNIISPFGG